MEKTDIQFLVETWRIHNKINLLLIAGIPSKGFRSVPSGSKGRTVAEQLDHMNRIRLGWMHYHRTGKRPSSSSVKIKTLNRTSLKKAFTASGKEFLRFSSDVISGKTRLRAFGNNPVRFMGYLISHESHHRGSILLALKQNDMHLPEKISLQGVWQSWMWGN